MYVWTGKKISINCMRNFHFGNGKVGRERLKKRTDWPGNIDSTNTSREQEHGH
jgi:hypothetical protein